MRLNAQNVKNAKLPAGFEVGPIREMPEKVVQFGEGVFLRAFVDWMFNALNKKGEFNGKVVVVQPIAQGRIQDINDQDGLYTLYLRGMENGQVVEKKEIISSISRGINPYVQWDEYVKLAQSPDIRYIVSNTTEAGIAYGAGDRLEQTPPASFPAKVTSFLHMRYTHFKGDPSKGMVIIPCELIDRNGDNLKKIVLRYAEEWNLGEEFINWLESSNYFLNTLVDRIVTGYPRDEIQKFTAEVGYEDTLFDTAEVFHLWVIEGDKKLAEELPFHKIGLNVVWTDNLEPYRTRKVRILNGAHTMTVLGAYLYGKNTVKECLDDRKIVTYMKQGIFEEIIPTFDLPEEEKKSFANSVLERFSNPFIKHYLMSIALNSVSKFKTRVLPSIQEYVNRKGELPDALSFSMAALIAFYRGTEINGNVLVGNRSSETYNIADDMPILEFFQKIWKEFEDAGDFESVTGQVLGNVDFWGEDLNRIEGFAEMVTGHLKEILVNGVEKALDKLLQNKVSTR